MISFNFPNKSPQSHKGILINKYVTVRADAYATCNNIQYLRRLSRSGKQKGIKICQMWFIEMESLEAYLQHSESTSDDRCGSRQFVWCGVFTFVND
jgi:hypothetical protein